MTDKDLLDRFANDAPGKPALWRWRGWPRFHWDTCNWYLSVSNLGGYRIERPYGSSRSVKVFHHSITPPEATCLMRDFLRVQLNKEGIDVQYSNATDRAMDGGGASYHIEPDHSAGKCLHYDDYNDAIVAAVEAQMEKEKPANEY